MMRRCRPTLQCLAEDLDIVLPPVNQPLDEIDHPILAKAVEQFAGAARRERIRSIDDQVLFKVKVQRWRGAVWTEPDLSWLVAAGWRAAGSPDDFYAALAADGKAHRALYNADHRPPLASDTYTTHLVPGPDDRIRYRIEGAVRLVRLLESLIPSLVRDSLKDGCEHAVDLSTFSLGVQVRADRGNESYVAICVAGSIPDDLTKVVLDIVPGCDRDGWFPETAMPDRLLSPNEQAWSTVMDPAVAAELLG